ncbi:hypothetical protein ABFV99_14115 [Cytobacillus horneckiae]|uniref:hypothetical protein n=1 Tax=Cytobacillus horneckiae TaxID=549687 RepID=UPI0034CDF737
MENGKINEVLLLHNGEVVMELEPLHVATIEKEAQEPTNPNLTNVEVMNRYHWF